MREGKENIVFGQHDMLDIFPNFKKTQNVIGKEYTWRRQPWSLGAFGVRPCCPADVAQRSEFPHK